MTGILPNKPRNTQQTDQQRYRGVGQIGEAVK